MSLQKLPLDDATLDQLIEFAEVAGIDVTDQMKLESGVGSLRAVVATAGYHTGIYVASRPVTLDAPPMIPGQALDDIFDPENERWIKFMITPDESGEEAMSHGCVFVSVNNDWAHVPRGETVVMRELLFRSLQVKERRWKQDHAASGQMIHKRRTSKMVDRYPMTVYGAVGYVNDGPPEMQPGELLIARGGTQAAAIAMQQQLRRAEAA